MQQIKLKDFGVSLNMDDTYISQWMHQHQHFYEYHMLEAIASMNLKGTYIDVGANFGNHSVFFDKFCSSTHVISIEPVPENYEYLCNNLINNRCEKSRPLNVGGGCQHSFMGWKKAPEHRMSQCQLSGNGKIPVIELNGLFIHDKVAVIKIDAEGMEYDILLGAGEILSNHTPDLFVEIWEDKALEEITDYLNQFGYRIIERYNEAPTYHFSARQIPVTFKP